MYLSPLKNFHLIIELSFHTLNLKFPFSQYYSYCPQLQKTKIIFIVTIFQYETKNKCGYIDSLQMNLKPDIKWGESWKVGNTINDNFQSKTYLIDFE